MTKTHCYPYLFGWNITKKHTCLIVVHAVYVIFWKRKWKKSEVQFISWIHVWNKAIMTLICLHCVYAVWMPKTASLEIYIYCRSFCIPKVSIVGCRSACYQGKYDVQLLLWSFSRVIYTKVAYIFYYNLVYMLLNLLI